MKRMVVPVICRVLALSALLGSGCARGLQLSSMPQVAPLQVLVLDPLSDQIACDCVAGYAHRDYGRLGEALSREVGCDVAVHYAEDLSAQQESLATGRWLIVGKDSSQRHTSDQLGVELHALARLRGLDGTANLCGLFVAAVGSGIDSLDDAVGRSICLGPTDAVEKDRLAVEALAVLGVVLPSPIRRATDCTAAALAVVDGDVDIAVVSSYALPLVEGCGAIQPGVLNVIGRTGTAPFITLFASPSIGEVERIRIREGLLRLNRDAPLMKAIESHGGFVAVR